MTGYANYSRKARMTAFLIDIISSPLGWLQKRPPISSPNRILAVRPDHLGDLLMSSGALYSLRKSHPRSEIHLLMPSWNRPAAHMLPFIDRFHCIDLPWYCFDGDGAASFAQIGMMVKKLRKLKFDLFVDLRGDPRLIMLFGWLTRCRIRRGFDNLGGRFFLNSTTRFDRSIHFCEQNMRLLEPFLNEKAAFRIRVEAGDALISLIRLHDLLPGSYIIVHPAVARYWKCKRWPEEHFAAVCRHLARRHGLRVVITTGPRERDVGDRVSSMVPGSVNLSGATSLNDLAYLLGGAMLLLSNDSAPMHLAVRVEAPLVAVFGPTDLRRSGPWPPDQRFRALEGDPRLPRPLFGVDSVDPAYFPSTAAVTDECDRLLALMRSRRLAECQEMSWPSVSYRSR